MGFGNQGFLSCWRKWKRVLESAAAVDSVLNFERNLNARFPSDKKYAFESRNGQVIKQYSTAYTIAYNKALNNMVENRFRQSIFAVASFWYTAWVNAGQPDLRELGMQNAGEVDASGFEELNRRWKTESLKGRSCD